LASAPGGIDVFPRAKRLRQRSLTSLLPLISDAHRQEAADLGQNSADRLAHRLKAFSDRAADIKESYGFANQSCKSGWCWTGSNSVILQNRIFFALVKGSCANSSSNLARDSARAIKKPPRAGT
jgi:hypothetical protein